MKIVRFFPIASSGKSRDVNGMIIFQPTERARIVIRVLFLDIRIIRILFRISNMNLDIAFGYEKGNIHKISDIQSDNLDSRIGY